MLSIARGYSVTYLTETVAKGRENYYTGAVAAGEPPGRWYGRGAESLGLLGLVDEQDMTALYEHFVDPRDEGFKDPSKWLDASTLGHRGRAYKSEEELYAAALELEPDASPERREELRLDAGKRARQNVAFLDATFSVPKSITVLHTAFEAQQVAAERAAVAATSEAERQQVTEAARAWGAHRQAVEDAIWAGNRAALDYLADNAGYSRIGHHGGAAGRFIDAHDWTVASFFQHDSRDHDPQLHIHNAILNRVEGADGEWRTLDSRAIHKVRGAAAAVGERTTEEHLARALGVRMATRPDGKAREVVGIAQGVMDLFSSRRRAITPKTRELVEAFEAKFDRAPNSLELDRLQRQATFATRKAKSREGETAEQRLDRWDKQLRAEVAGGLEQVAHDVLAHAQRAPEAARWEPSAVIETALADVQAKKAAWTRPDLARAISDALPDRLGDLDGRQVTKLVDGLTDQALALAVPLDAARPGEAALPDALRLANGESTYQAPAGRVYATPEHVRSERTLAAAATAARTAPALTGDRVRRFVGQLRELGIELGADQQAAVTGVLSSGADVESLVGPAGAGKSFVIGALAKAWQDAELWDGRQRRVFGLAASQIATDVLAGEGVEARNISRWLSTQQRLTAEEALPEDADWRLRAGDLVVVDESAMADTAALATIHAHVSNAGAKLLLTGDHRQLAAVGAGGGMELAASSGNAYELTEARRFRQEWERAASLRLRSADETVLGDYAKHGRLLDAGTREQAEASAARAWLADTLAGQHALLIVDSNEQAAAVSADLRAELVRLGRVDEHGVPLGRQGTFAGRGDLVQARLNGWDLAGYEGNQRGPINRETYRVLDTREDGGLVVAPVIGRTAEGEHLGARMSLPGSYVAEHVALGYAATVHAAQGLTVDRCHGVITPNTIAEALYVALSRGRDGNWAHVTTVAVPDDAPDGATNEAVHRNPAAVLAGAFETADPERSALATATESADETGSVRTPAELLADAAELATAGRTARWLDELVDHGHMTERDRVRLAAEDGGSSLSRLLRRAELAGHDPKVVLADAVAVGPLGDARQVSSVLHARITTNKNVSLDPRGDHYADWTPKVDDPQWAAYLDHLARAADERRDALADDVLAHAQQWAVEALGPPPADEAARAVWARKASVVAAHRELTGHDDPAAAIGAAPKRDQVEAYASWRAAWRALGRPEADRDELEMSDGQLRMRIRAYQREEAWAPEYVANELNGTHQSAEQHRQTAAMRRAEAANADDAAERQRLEQEAAEAAALADVLDQSAEHLRLVDQARADWLAHTAETRSAADRAQSELSARIVDDEQPAEPAVTAEEWLDAHRESDRVEDPHRAITAEADLADEVDQRQADRDAVEPVAEPAADAVETDVADVRAAAADEPTPDQDDRVRVPSADETADSVDRAQRALAELEQRRAAEQARAAEEARADQVARWQAEAAAEHDREVNAEREATPVLEVGQP
ncbi:MAG: relaxase domain-containing protein [Actinophytocola sp.]|nr:relaxase domain-containing protein [Actinophytocola sp.]